MDNDKGFNGACLYAAYQAKKTAAATEYIKYDGGLSLLPGGEVHVITLLMEAGQMLICLQVYCPVSGQA